MEKRQLGGALLIFVGAFGVTTQLMAKKEWTANHYMIMGVCAILIGIGLYAATKPKK